MYHLHSALQGLVVVAPGLGDRGGVVFGLFGSASSSSSASGAVTALLAAGAGAAFLATGASADERSYTP
jgi:hypothetical protein